MSGDSYFVERLKDTVVSLLSNERIDFRFDNRLSIGNGYNDFAKGIFQRSRFILVVGNECFDEFSPCSCFELAQAAFHEARHVMHHADRMRGQFDTLSDRFTFVYLAREQNGARYKLGYPNNVFELDANAYSVVEAKRFCEPFFPGVDFDEIACNVWQNRCESENTRFVTNWDNISSAEDIVKHMHLRILDSITDSNLNMCKEDDAVWQYMNTRASDMFCDFWKNAESDFIRDKLCAAVLVGSGFSSVLYPNVDMLDWTVDGFDVLEDVRMYQTIRSVLRSEIEWSCESDVKQSLKLALSSQLSLSSVKTGLFDYVSINRHGLSIEHRSPDWTGSRHESELFNEHIVDVALSGLENGSLVPFSGTVPNLVSDWVNIVKTDNVRNKQNTLIVLAGLLDDNSLQNSSHCIDTQFEI